MQTRIWVGLLMILVGPVSLFLAVRLGEAGNNDLAAVFVALGLLGGMWGGIVGYRVLRGGTSLREVPRLLGAFVGFIVLAFVLSNCPAQSR